MDVDDAVVLLPIRPRSTPRGDPMAVFPLLSGFWPIDDRFDEAPSSDDDDDLSDEFAPPEDVELFAVFLEEWPMPLPSTR